MNTEHATATQKTARSGAASGPGAGGINVGKVLGFEIRIDFSWFVILVLILWSFSAGVFPAEYPDLASRTYLIMGSVGALLFFASLLVHELSHSVVARSKGIPVEGITLFIFGGMARTRMEAEEPGDEFVIAAVGPLASVVIAAIFWGVWWFGTRMGWTVAVTGVARYLAFLNALLAAFNLLPGFPLDGGRLFRSAVWKFSGDLTKATRWASTGGRWLGYLLMGFGALQLLAGGVIGGLWLLFIGWFLRSAAEASYRQHWLRKIFDRVPAREIMTSSPETVTADLTIQELVDQRFLRRAHQAYPVVENGRPVGLITLQHVKEIPREEWSSRRVRDAMRDAEGITVEPHEGVTRVLELMQENGERRILVARHGQLVGIISASDVAGWIQRAEALEELQG